MREIKFRAWDNNLETMFLIGQMEFFEGGNISVNDGLMYMTGMGRQFELMQYAGLKDKNGKEIYEGDIIETRWIFCKNIPRGQIKFKRGCFIVEWINDDELNDILDIHGKEAEIIGNIYENPEILRDSAPNDEI